ncbi:alcohol dehydrogenase catalytic domain-containing protein [Streptomyces mirabilis]|uniref:alcohol dehydrogenase catalytic domain-containing protein n=1 Tax=Streptomyces mirabilis TaxID=68239 RepID=UPI0033CAD18A
MFSRKAWRVERFGTPREAVRLQDMTWEEPKPGQVLIRVRTAGTGFPDLLRATGRFPLLGDPPFGLGEEATGEVVAVPPGSRFAPGDRVTRITGFLEGWGG